ncbi:MAG: protease modulator HflC [Lachnospiraceae bacterium]|nr:protease modulator HflC [Lachnospiraceae bacterium]
MEKTEHFDSNGNPVKSGKKAGGKKFPVLVILVVLALIVLRSCLIITYANQYKLVRQFGKVQRVITEAGINFKVPFIETVDTVPKQLLIYDLPASDVITSDKKTMIVDSYVLWRVTDPLKFAQTLSGSVGNAEGRIDTIVYNATKNTISNMTQDAVILSRDGKMTVTVTNEAETNGNDLDVSGEEKQVVEITSLTEEIMNHIADIESQYGIDIVTVDVKKLDLPDDNKQAVYTRMISERENIAAQYAAEGEAQAQIIENTTDREVSIMISNAQAKAEAIIAEGEAEYMSILSDAYNDPERADFYSFVRALDALKSSMQGGQKTVILSEDSPITGIFYGKY